MRRPKLSMLFSLALLLPVGWPHHLLLGAADPPGGAHGLEERAHVDARYQYLAGGANTGQGWAIWNPNGTFASMYVRVDRGARQDRVRPATASQTNSFAPSGIAAPVRNSGAPPRATPGPGASATGRLSRQKAHSPAAVLVCRCVDSHQNSERRLWTGAFDDFTKTGRRTACELANLRSLALAEFRASTDGLTGLPNQRAVKDTLKRMAAHTSRNLSPLSAIMLDLGHFKKINDTYGHGRADDVLAAAGAVLNETVRTSDFVGRNGAEEFIVLLPDTDAEEARIVAEKIRATIAAISVSGVERAITVSLGIASIPQHAGDGDQLVRSADRALYLAKTNGRNRVETAIVSSRAGPERPPVDG